MKHRVLIDGVTARFLIAALSAAAGGLGLAVAAGAQSDGVPTAGPSGTGTATAVTGTTTATTGGSGGSGGHRIPRNERTHPSVSPSSGAPTTRFELSFTLRQTPGHQGALATDYRLEVAPHRGAAKTCWSPQPAPITSGKTGDRVTLALVAPSGGWCHGRYRATVFLDRGPYCPPPQNGQPQPCPEFATQEMLTGRTHFTVR